MRASFLLVAMLVLGSASGQENDLLERAGWPSLPDSLFLIWKLDKDQIKRVGMIEEDYNAERAKVMSDTVLTDKDREARLAALAVGRRKELQGVLTADHYQDWIERSNVAHP